MTFRPQVVKLGLQTCMAEPEEDRIGTTGRDGGNGSAPMSNPNTQAPAAGAIVEKPLPPGVASVLWELECCAAQARVTLMNLSEGRPNHFGVFRACVYVEEMRILETKVRERGVGGGVSVVGGGDAGKSCVNRSWSCVSRTFSLRERRRLLILSLLSLCCAFLRGQRHVEVLYLLLLA